MVLICYLKKSALAILQKVTSHENWNPLTLPPLGTERIMINAHEISRNWERSYQISETKFKLLISMMVLKSGANFDLWILLLPLLVCLSHSLLDVITQQGTECVKSGPSWGQHQRAGPHTPPVTSANRWPHWRQVVHMRKRESVSQLAFNLYFKRQSEI